MWLYFLVLAGCISEYFDLRVMSLILNFAGQVGLQYAHCFDVVLFDCSYEVAIMVKMDVAFDY